MSGLTSFFQEISAPCKTLNYNIFSYFKFDMAVDQSSEFGLRNDFSPMPIEIFCLVLSNVSCTHAFCFLHGREVLLCMWCECLYY